MNFKKKSVYLDYAATTPIDERVLKSMCPFFQTKFGNPSSIHQFGQDAEVALENARSSIAINLNCSESEIIFTSGGSESNNLALKGLLIARREFPLKNHILITPVEHPAITMTAKHLAHYYGAEVEFLRVDSCGLVDPDEVKNRIRSNTLLVSVIFGNNEIGTLNPISEIGKVCREKEVIFHTDAVQAAAHLRINVEELLVDMMSVGAHKFYGPKGVGFLYVRRGTNIVPTQNGGNQEYGFRAGTENVPNIVGLAVSFDIAQHEYKIRTENMLKLRDRLISNILEKIPKSYLTGHPRLRLPNHTSFIFENIDGNQLVIRLDLDGYACSSGSACKTGNPEPSEVLTALGNTPALALGSMRATLGMNTNSDDIERFLEKLPSIIEDLRE